MPANIATLTRRLHKIGASWAVSSSKCVLPDDPLEDQIAGRKTYHVHPDTSEPRSEYIQCFDNLRELEAWIREQMELRRAPERGERLSVSLPDEWREELRRRYGSVQAGVEQIVKKELENV